MPTGGEMSACGSDACGPAFDCAARCSNPKKRLTAAETKQDTWIQTAADSDLTGARKQLKKYNASRKLRKAALGIIAQQRMQRAMQNLQLKNAEKAAAAGEGAAAAGGAAAGS